MLLTHSLIAGLQASLQLHSLLANFNTLRYTRILRVGNEFVDDKRIHVVHFIRRDYFHH